jgi:hypothetical protein
LASKPIARANPVQPPSEAVGDIVNLRRARKNAQRRAAQRTASEQRYRHGRSKAERQLDSAQDAKTRRDLDGHRIESGDEE